MVSWIVILALACSGKVGDSGGGGGSSSGDGSSSSSGDGGDKDADGDGYDIDTDCDDNDPTIHPYATEVCDGVDQDCNGEADDGLAFGYYYPDGDGDGYGGQGADTGYVPEEGCAPPPGYGIGERDCDDTDPKINPDADEVCDDLDLDENCNGVTDNNDGTALESTKSWFYTDYDGDTYGGEKAASLLLCEANDVYTSPSNDDCNDYEFDVNPGIKEYCDDGIDNDCSGTTDICEALGEYSLERSEARKLIGTSGSEELGGLVAGIGDTDGDGNDDMLVAAVSGGSATLVLGPVSSRANLSTVTEASFTGTVTGLGHGGNIDGDAKGYDDILIGDSTAGSGGAVSIASGPISGTHAMSSFVTLSGASGDEVGTAMDGGHDVAGGTIEDVLIGAPGAASGNGAAYLVYGHVTAGGALSGIADITFEGNSGIGIGETVAIAEDLNGDGDSDVVLGAPGAGGSGAVFVFHGGFKTGTIAAADSLGVFSGTTGDLVGTSIDSIGDVNGDGWGNLIIGAPAVASDEGAAYLILGPASGISAISSAAQATFTGELTNQTVGFSVTGGDFDGDGNSDVFIGSERETSGKEKEAAWLFLGPLTGSMAVSTADTYMTGEAAGDMVGRSVSGMFDNNGDGFADFLIGAPGESSGASHGGSVYLVIGR